MAKKKAKRLHPRVDIRITSYRRRKHDPDGVSVKYALDGIVRRGLLEDDSTQEVRRVIFESIVGDDEKTIIEIFDAEPLI